MIAVAATSPASALVGGQVPNASTARPELAFLVRRLGLADARSLVTARVDLDGDGRPETIVYVADPGSCGMAGCLLYVLSRVHGRVRLVMRATIANPPVRVLSTRTRGWRDLAVEVAGGGLQPHRVRLRHTGWNAFVNPGLAPATTQTGEVLITRAAADRVFARRADLGRSAADPAPR